MSQCLISVLPRRVRRVNARHLGCGHSIAGDPVSLALTWSQLRPPNGRTRYTAPGARLCAPRGGVPDLVLTAKGRCNWGAR